MPRIILAYWHGDHSPGDEIDVTGEELAALQRDGRVAEVISDPHNDGGTLTPALVEKTNDSGQAEAVVSPPPQRKRR